MNHFSSSKDSNLTCDYFACSFFQSAVSVTCLSQRHTTHRAPPSSTRNCLVTVYRAPPSSTKNCQVTVHRAPPSSTITLVFKFNLTAYSCVIRCRLFALYMQTYFWGWSLTLMMKMTTTKKVTRVISFLHGSMTQVRTVVITMYSTGTVVKYKHTYTHTSDAFDNVYLVLALLNQFVFRWIHFLLVVFSDSSIEVFKEIEPITWK